MTLQSHTDVPRWAAAVAFPDSRVPAGLGERRVVFCARMGSAGIHPAGERAAVHRTHALHRA